MKRTMLAKVVYAACSLIFILSLCGTSFFYGAMYYKAHGDLTECATYQKDLRQQEEDRIEAQKRFSQWCKKESKWPCKMTWETELVPKNRV